MIDLLFLAHNRLEFTEAAARELFCNTEWDLVRSVHQYWGSLAHGPQIGLMDSISGKSTKTLAELADLWNFRQLSGSQGVTLL